MSPLAYITPDTIPDTEKCRALLIPDDPIIYAAVSGALQLLTFPENWEQVGATTVDEITAAMQTMYDAFLASDCGGLTDMTIKFALVSHNVASGVNAGGIVVSPAVNKCPWNLIPFDNIGISLAASVINMPAGLYACWIMHRLGITTGNHYAYAQITAGAPAQTFHFHAHQTPAHRVVQGFVMWNTAAQFDWEVDLISTVALASTGWGVANAISGVNEQYGQILIAKIENPS